MTWCLTLFHVNNLKTWKQLPKRIKCGTIKSFTFPFLLYRIFTMQFQWTEFLSPHYTGIWCVELQNMSLFEFCWVEVYFSSSKSICPYWSSTSPCFNQIYDLFSVIFLFYKSLTKLIKFLYHYQGSSKEKVHQRLQKVLLYYIMQDASHFVFLIYR